MKKVVVAILCAVQMFAFGGFVYGWGLDSIKPAALGGGGVTKADVDNYFSLSNKADDLQQGSVDSLSKMLLNKDTAAEIERKKKAAEAIQNPQEKQAAMKQIVEDEQAALITMNDDKASQQKLANLDEHQKKLVGAATSNLFLSALLNKSAVDVATGIVQKAQANPASAVGYATELPKIKDAVVALPGKIEKTYTLANQLMKLAKANNIEVAMPKTASDKPQVAENF